jgi:DNA-binding NarL/FixJ family response regulator
MSMKSYQLEMGELVSLKALHRQTPERRYADRLEAVILLGSGWSTGDIAEALLVDRDTVRKYYQYFTLAVQAFHTC